MLPKRREVLLKSWGNFPETAMIFIGQYSKSKNKIKCDTSGQSPQTKAFKVCLDDHHDYLHMTLILILLFLLTLMFIYCYLRLYRFLREREREIYIYISPNGPGIIVARCLLLEVSSIRQCCLRYRIYPQRTFEHVV